MVPVPFAPVMENFVIPDTEQIVDAAKVSQIRNLNVYSKNQNNS